MLHQSNPFSLSVVPAASSGRISVITPLVGFRSLDPQDDPINPWRRPAGVSPWMNTCSWAYQGLGHYSSGAFSPAYGTFGGYVATGGGHASCFGGEVYVYDIGANRWRRINFPYENRTRTGVMPSFFHYVQANPYNLPLPMRGAVNVGGAAWVPPPGYDPVWGDWDGRYPEGTETYDLLEVIPPDLGGGSAGTLVMLSSGSMAGGGKSGRGIWQCPLDTGKWARVLQIPGNVTVNSGGGGVCFDPRRGVIYQLQHGANVYAFDFQAKRYTWLSAFPNVVTVDSCCTFHAAADLLIYMKTYLNYGSPNFEFPRLYAWSPVTKRTTRLNCVGQLPASGGNLSSGVSSRTMGVEYCPANKALYSFSLRRTPIYDGVNDQFSVWRCTPPPGARTTEQYLAGTWTWTLDNAVDSGYRGIVLSTASMRNHIQLGFYNQFRWAPSMEAFIAPTYNGDGGIIVVQPGAI
jgi:hypothetical protein